MATSGSTDFNLTGTQWVTDALELIGVVKEGTDITDQQLDRGLRAANRLLKSESAEFHLWKFEEITIFGVVGQAKYDLPGANGALTADIATTTTDADEATSQTVISVTKTTGFTNSDTIGIVLDDDTIHWTTISSFVTDDTVTIASGLASAAASGNKVYVYTTAVVRPLKVLTARSSLNDNDTPELQVLGRTEYDNLPDKTIEASPVQVYYDPQITIGELFLWPTPDDVAKVYKITVQQPIEDLDAGTDNIDVPQEWLDYLVYKLAIRRAPAYGKSLSQEILLVYAELKDRVESWDEEDEPISFQLMESHRDY